MLQNPFQVQRSNLSFLHQQGSRQALVFLDTSIQPKERKEARLWWECRSLSNPTPKAFLLASDLKEKNCNGESVHQLSEAALDWILTLATGNKFRELWNLAFQ